MRENSLNTVFPDRTILISRLCLCLLVFTWPMLAQTKQGTPASTKTQKNTDGTTTTIESIDGGTRATTKDSKGKLVDVVTTEQSDKYGKGGTKAKIESHKGSNDIDIIVYKDKSGNVRRLEQTEFINNSPSKNTFDVEYDESGRLKSYAYGRVGRLEEEGKIEYDDLGRPSTVLMEVSLFGGVRGRITYKYGGADDKTGTKTVESYSPWSKKWQETAESKISRLGFDKVVEVGKQLLAATREATERRMSIVEDLRPIEPDMETPKPKKEDSQKDTKSGNTAGKLDACLVGTWRSESGYLVHEGPGGSGVLLTIKADGTTTIDYGGMAEMKDILQGEFVQSTAMSGKASGRISTSDGKITVESVEDSALSITQTKSDGTTRTSHPRGLGTVFFGRGSYTCDESTLTIKSESNGLAVATFVFKKEKH